MVPIGGKPIIWHIMNIYAKYGHSNFFVALGYKSELIKEYFLKYSLLNSDLSVNLSSGKVDSLSSEDIDWQVSLINTGVKTMTGGRIKKLKEFIGNETFMLTYGDGVADIQIDKLLNFHKEHGKIGTLSAVRPVARFGDLEFNGDAVSSFKEKPQLHEGWINGGFFVFEPEIFDLLKSDEEMLEREPMERLVNKGELMAFKHNGFWHSMDTKRDKDRLEHFWENGAPWHRKGL
jgi:glucose-1-phosphate cytidylyltransferase